MEVIRHDDKLLKRKSAKSEEFKSKPERPKTQHEDLDELKKKWREEWEAERRRADDELAEGHIIRPGRESKKTRERSRPVCD